MNSVVMRFELPVLSRSTVNNSRETAFGGGRIGLVPGKPLGVSCLPSLAYSGAINNHQIFTVAANIFLSTLIIIISTGVILFS